MSEFRPSIKHSQYHPHTPREGFYPKKWCLGDPWSVAKLTFREYIIIVKIIILTKNKFKHPCLSSDHQSNTHSTIHTRLEKGFTPKSGVWVTPGQWQN